MGDQSEWISWNGGECPVDGDVLVQVHFRCWKTRVENERKNPFLPALHFRWDRRDMDSDLIAYRLSQAPR